MLVFCALIVLHYSEISFKTFLYRRSVRLLVPWVFWSLIYAVAKVSKHFIVHGDQFDSFTLNWFLIGGSIHLWYLPFAFLASIILYYSCRYTFKKGIIGSKIIIGAICLGVLATYISSFMMEKFVFVSPFIQWLFALPALPIGFCLGMILREIPEKDRAAWLLGVLIVMLLVFAGLFYMKKESLIVSYSVGLLLTIMSLKFRFPFETVGIHAGKLTYGIYLIHPMVAFFTQKMIGKQNPAMVIMSTFVISAIMVFFMRYTFLRKVI